MGELMVNLPVTVIIILAALLISSLGAGWSLSLIGGAGIGWYFWAILLRKWKDWALRNNVDRERLFRLGKLGLINFYRHKIFEE